jgi:hypothetical protein
MVRGIQNVQALPFLRIGPPVELPGALRGFLSGALLDTGMRNRAERNKLYDILQEEAEAKTEKMLTEGAGFNVFKSIMSAGVTVRNPQIDLSAELLEVVFPRPNWPLLVRDSKKLIYNTEQEVTIWFQGTRQDEVPRAGSQYCYIRETVCKKLTFEDVGSADRGEMRMVRGDNLVYYVQKIEASESLIEEIGEAIGELL